MLYRRGSYLNPGMHRPVDVVWQEVEALHGELGCPAKDVPSNEQEDKSRAKKDVWASCTRRLL